MSRKLMVIAGFGLCAVVAAVAAQHVLRHGPTPHRPPDRVQFEPIVNERPPSNEFELQELRSRIEELNARVARSEGVRETAPTIDEATTVHTASGAAEVMAVEVRRQTAANLTTLDGRMNFESVDTAWAASMTADLDSGITEMFPGPEAGGIIGRNVVCSTSICRVVLQFADAAQRHEVYSMLGRLRPFRNKHTMVYAVPDGTEAWIYAGRPDVPLPLDFGRPGQQP